MAGKIGIHSMIDPNSSGKINIKTFDLISVQRESAFILYNVSSSKNTTLEIEVKNKDTNETNRVVIPNKSEDATFRIENLKGNSNYQITLLASNDVMSSRSLPVDFKTKLIYQISIDKNNSNCSSCLSYGLDAIGINTATNTSLEGWQDKWPFNEMKLVAVDNNNGEEVGTVKLTDKTRYDDGAFLHENNDVFLKLPKIYYEFEGGNTLKISNYKFSLTCDCFAHRKNGNEKDYIYLGAFLGATDNQGKLRSKVGMTPKTDFTIDQFIDNIKSINNKYELTYFTSITLIQILFILAYKSLHSNFEIGVGCTSNRLHTTGGSSSKGFVFGDRNYTTDKQVLFLGLEDLWGNLYQFLNGCTLSDNGELNIFNNEDKSDKRSYQVPDATENYMTEAYWENDKGFLAKNTTGGSNTTYYTDKAEVHYINNEIEKVAIFGGFTVNDSGIFTTLLRYRRNLHGQDVGARLMMFGSDSAPSKYTKKIIIDLKGIELSKISNNWKLVNGNLEYQFTPTGETVNINDLINIRELIPSGTRFNGLYFAGTKDEVNEIVLDNNDINIEVDNEQLFAFNIDLAEKTENSVKLNYTLTNPHISSSTKEINLSEQSDLIINNGTVYNLREISDDIQRYTITAEVNGQPYNDITVDKINKTVTINNLVTNNDYNIYLIATIGSITERSNVINARLEKPPIIYGVRVDEGNPNPQSSVTYIESAVGITSANSTSLGGWENKWPFNKIRIVGFKNGQVVKEIKKDNKTQYTDGSTVPTDVDVMVEIPKIYYDFTDINNYEYELRISNKRFNSTCDCYAHKVGGVEKDFIYVGAYLGYIENEKLRSISGVTPTQKFSMQQVRQYANNVGTGYQQFNWFTLTILQILYLLAFKNLASKFSLGIGLQNYDDPATTGKTNKLGFIYGNTNERGQICLFGIEDIYGNVYQLIDGIKIDNSYNIMISSDNKNFNNKQKKVGKRNKSVNGYINKMMSSNENAFVPASGFGHPDRYYSDEGHNVYDEEAIYGYSGIFNLKFYCSGVSYSNFSRLVFLGE